MALVKTSITIPEDLLKEAKGVSGNFSAVVTEALKDYLKKKTVKKAVRSFGSWDEREKDSVAIVSEGRRDTGRRYADSDH